MSFSTFERLEARKMTRTEWKAYFNKQKALERIAEKDAILFPKSNEKLDNYEEHGRIFKLSSFKNADFSSFSPYEYMTLDNLPILPKTAYDDPIQPENEITADDELIREKLAKYAKRTLFRVVDDKIVAKDKCSRFPFVMGNICRCDERGDEIPQNVAITDTFSAILMQLAVNSVISRLKWIYSNSGDKYMLDLLNQAYLLKKSPVWNGYFNFLEQENSKRKRERPLMYLSRYRMITVKTLEPTKDGKKREKRFKLLKKSSNWTLKPTVYGRNVVNTVLPANNDAEDLFMTAYATYLECCNNGIIWSINSTIYAKNVVNSAISQAIREQKRANAESNRPVAENGENVEDFLEKSIENAQNLLNSDNSSDFSELISNLSTTSIFDSISNYLLANVPFSVKDGEKFKLFVRYYLTGEKLDTCANLCKLNKNTCTAWKVAIEKVRKSPKYHDFCLLLVGECS